MLFVVMISLQLTYLEFYSGIGGWGYALEHALRNIAAAAVAPQPHLHLTCRLLGAFDHSDLCKSVFSHNHNQDNKKLVRQTPIERITQQELEALAAQIWCMSPPCQPHTRQHSNQQYEIDDPRSASFLHLCDMIGSMEESTLPCLVMLENVVGFEMSGQTQSTFKDDEANRQQRSNHGSFQIWREVLSKREYHVSHFHLDPTDIGIPNARPRHYSVAFRPGSLHAMIKDVTFSTQLKSLCSLESRKYDKLFTKENLDEPPIIHGRKALGCEPPTLPCIGDFLDEECELESLKIPKNVWSSSSAWCFDVVTKLHHRSACFTHSYGKFIRGTGSIMYTGPLETKSDADDIYNNNKKPDKTAEFLAATRFDLEAPEKRIFDADWSSGIDWDRHMRYLSGNEIARLLGFPVGMSPSKNHLGESFRKFSFPSTVSVKQQWKLLGNSLNVKVAGKVAEVGIRCLFMQ